MISSTYQYLCDEAKPRLRSILLGSGFWGALLIGSTVGTFGDQLLLGQTKVGDIVTVLLTYSAIAFGFCLSGLTLALTLPDREFAKKLANSQKGQRHDAYSDLLFVFSWTAICHWIAITITISALVFAGLQQKIFPYNISTYRRTIVALMTFIFTYGLFQFLITLITLSQVGRIYIASLKNFEK